MEKLIFVFNIEPQPKQSVRSRIAKRKDGKQYIAHYQPKSKELYVENLADMAKKQLPLDFKMIEGIIHVAKLHYIYTVPKFFTKKQVEFVQSGGIIEKGTQPDIVDNLNKPLFDALQGIVYKNDGQITTIDNAKKYYGIESKIILELEYGR